ncbi:hypothetical protein DBR06_SOUSAS36410003 [Sousa chinensis]|nr:hypothetical protein DBR06_SOUSAS36410003 [Sousa chinensis]
MRSQSRAARLVTSPLRERVRAPFSLRPPGAGSGAFSLLTAHAPSRVSVCVSNVFRALGASSSVRVLGRYSALFLGVVYGAKRYDYLKPRAEEERRIAAEEKKKQDEQRRIERELAEGTRVAEPHGFVLHPHFQKQLLVQMSPTVEGKGRCLGPCWPLGPLLGEWEGEQVPRGQHIKVSPPFPGAVWMNKACCTV